MGSTIEDAQYEIYLEDLKEGYIKALEKFATSKNISEMKDNYEELLDARSEIEDWMTDTDRDDFNYIQNKVSDLKSIEDIYEKLIKDSKVGKIYFIIGCILSIIGISLTLISLL